jgi:hypothetical protein
VSRGFMAGFERGHINVWILGTSSTS